MERLRSPLRQRRERLVTDDGAWCWFADPRAIRHRGQRDCTYAGWVTSAGDIVVAQLTRSSRRSTGYTLSHGLDANDHANPSLLIDSDGLITAFYSAHNGSAIFRRTTTAPEDISDWGPEVRLELNRGGNPRDAYTYPTPLGLTSGALALLWRGDYWKPTMATSTNLEIWTEATTLMIRPDASVNNRPYFKAVPDGETLHFAMTDGHPATEVNNSIYYFRHENTSVARADGSVIGEIGRPVHPSAADIVFDAKVHGYGGWVWDLAIDNSGSPVVAYAVFPTKDEHVLCWSRWDGSAWVTHRFPPAGSWFPADPAHKPQSEPYYSGGIALDHENPNIVFTSRQISGVFEIERWITKDAGKTWSSTPVTAKSGGHNVRPVVIRRHGRTGPHVMWMRIDGWYRTYRDFRTSILMA